MSQTTNPQAIHDKIFNILEGSEEIDRGVMKAKASSFQPNAAEVERAQKFTHFADEFGAPRPATKLMEEIIGFYGLNIANDPSKKHLSDTAQQMYGHDLLQALALPWKNAKTEAAVQVQPAKPEVQTNTMGWLSHALGMGKTPKDRPKSSMRLV